MLFRSRAVMDRSSQPSPELTTLEAVGNQWRYALVVVQAGDDDDDELLNLDRVSHLGIAGVRLFTGQMSFLLSNTIKVLKV